jgi:hypothetical protein
LVHRRLGNRDSGCQAVLGHPVAPPSGAAPSIESRRKTARCICLRRVRPNHSLHPGPATAGGVSPVCDDATADTHRAYTARLRGPGELER